MKNGRKYLRLFLYKFLKLLHFNLKKKKNNNKNNNESLSLKF